MNKDAMHKITYGLYILTAKEGDKDNGCIVNTVCQVTSTPNRIAVAVNKENYTHDMIKRTGMFNVSVLTENSKFDTYKHWGFQSGNKLQTFRERAYIYHGRDKRVYIGKGSVVNGLRHAYALYRGCGGRGCIRQRCVCHIQLLSEEHQVSAQSFRCAEKGIHMHDMRVHI